MFFRINSFISSVVWGAPMLAVFLGTGAFLSFRSRFYQIFGIKDWLGSTLGVLFKNRKKEKSEGSVSQFSALASSLAACLGTGNIIGVATALSLGGPGAVFWMLLSGILGMMTCCCENILAVKYRIKDSGGKICGGPMYYIENGLGMNGVAKVYSLLLIGASLGMGNMTQANAVASSLASFGADALPVGFILAAVLIFAVSGGVARISEISEKLVPLLTVGFVCACIAVIVKNIGNLLPSVSLIFRCAFSSEAISGYSMAKAVRYGVSRGVFSNEAGLGSNTLIHACADCSEPGVQGKWGILEVGIDTVFMCTLTALAILTSGVWQAEPSLTGVELCSAVFESVFGVWGKRILNFSTCLFAFGTLLAWSYYGKSGAVYFFGKRSGKYYSCIYVAAAFAGCLLSLESVWAVSDILNGLMAVPNLFAVINLSAEALELLEKSKVNHRRKFLRQ